MEEGPALGEAADGDGCLAMLTCPATNPLPKAALAQRTRTVMDPRYKVPDVASARGCGAWRRLRAHGGGSDMQEPPAALLALS